MPLGTAVDVSDPFFIVMALHLMLIASISSSPCYLSVSPCLRSNLHLQNCLKADKVVPAAGSLVIPCTVLLVLMNFFQHLLLQYK
jgi:hypothetical protein